MSRRSARAGRQAAAASSHNSQGPVAGEPLLPWLRERFHHAVSEWHHHMLVAAMLASLTLVAVEFHALDWLDALMLRVTAPLASSLEDAPRINVVPVLIGASLYHSASGFGGVSPLNRDKLAPLLQTLMEARPQVLLIDLQLEPGVADPSADRLLALPAGVPAPSVLLPLPALSDGEGEKTSLAWMQAQCRLGLRFGDPDLRSHGAVVVRFDRMPGLLPFDAAQLALGLEHPGKHAHGHEAAAMSTMCERALADPPPSLALLHALKPSQNLVGTRIETQPLYPAGVVAAHGRAIWLQSCGAGLCASGERLGVSPLPLQQALAQRRAAQADKPLVLVLGGDYDPRDRLPILGQPRAGAVVHAAAIASFERTQESHLVAWLIDILIGTAVAPFLLLAWAMVDRWRGKTPCPSCHTPQQPAPLRSPEATPPTLGWRLGQLLAADLRNLTLLLPWLLALLICLLVTQVAGLLLGHGWWINPGPVILGMAIHTLLEKDAVMEGSRPAERQPASRWWLELLAYAEASPMRLAHGLLALLALVYLLAHAVQGHG